MAELFNKDTDTIGLHLRNIFKEQELEEKLTTEDLSVVQTEGNRQVRRTVKFYNLDAVISVGYRVNSKQGTQFRQWATQRLKDYLVQGYAIEEKAASLLYLIIKNHGFVDGNTGKKPAAIQSVGRTDREQRGIGRPDLVCGLQQTRRDEHGEKAGHQRTESQSIVS